MQIQCFNPTGGVEHPWTGLSSIPQNLMSTYNLRTSYLEIGSLQMDLLSN